MDNSWEISCEVAFSREKKGKRSEGSQDVFFPDDVEWVAREIRQALSHLPFLVKMRITGITEIDTLGADEQEEWDTSEHER